MEKLSLLGGKKVREKLFSGHCTIGKEEKEAVNKVLNSGTLSKFKGSWGQDFLGGPQVRAFEKEWSDFFNIKHSISVNSNTSGLIASMGAIGLTPGDEVVVTPYSMSISATAPLFYGGIPVFADVESDHFCISPESFRKKITNKTKAIIIVDLFGNPFNEEIISIAKEKNIIVIEDAAQAPGASSNGKMAGTLADIGVFSLNYHKHIHTGEGGVIVTNNDEFAERLRLIRNHAESVVENQGTTNLTNMLGFNFRMTEIEAAIGREQLKKLPQLLDKRIENANYLRKQLTELPGISGGIPRQNCKHAYYALGLKYDKTKIEIDRNLFIHAVKAELPACSYREQDGPLVGRGYVKPIYLLPIFQKKKALGKDGFPFNLSEREYNKGDCPTVEELHSESLIHTQMIEPQLSMKDMNDVIKAFQKVYENRQALKGKQLKDFI